jgi:hypothetical protein
MLLYVFISCESRIDKCYQRIIDMMKKINYDNFIIVTGSNKNYYNSKTHILNIDCNDMYEGLPEKVIKSFKFISESKPFNKYTHFCKLDDDMVINNLVNIDKVSDYCGYVEETYVEDRKWHIGKCSINSKFNNTEYKGIFVPWCLGGLGYILSKKSLNRVATATNYKDEIYEDLYIAKILNNNNIFPQNIDAVTQCLFSPDHSN